ncbi:MAG: ABC transporter ATP-binding protein [Clostridia bacterium]|nr:ABC transporter ATP-binding protein [Clostridia bacterium]
MLIEAKDISFGYGPTNIFNKLSLNINVSEVLCILGPNGAGKTTLMNCLVGLYPVKTGKILLEGQDILSLSPRYVAQRIGYVPQVIVPTFSYSVLEYVVTGCAPHIGTFERPGEEEYEKAMAALREMGIARLSDKAYNEISGGERQQASIARVLAQKPSVILMDEPTAHLDYGNQYRVLDTIHGLKEKGFGVVLTTHNPDHPLMLGGRVAVIDREGNYVGGTAEEVINESFLKKLYGVDLQMTHVEALGRATVLPPKI